MVRVVAIVLCLTACGRLRFDARDDAGGDATAPVCAEARTVTAGRDHSCLVDEVGDVWCWGLNVYGAVDPSVPADVVLLPIRVAGLPGDMTAVEAGRDFTCAMNTTGDVWCWGSNNLAQLGSLVGAARVGPLQVPGVLAVQLEVAAATVCVRRQGDHAIVCWGDGQFGENGTGVSYQEPVLLASTAGAKDLALGHRHGCYIDPNDEVQCWGRNGNSQLGMPGASRFMRGLVPGAMKSRAIALGGRTTCSASQTGVLQCWGENNVGELGTGDTDQRDAPALSMFDGAVELAGGTYTFCARRADNTGGCWGELPIGDGTLTHQFTPGSWGALRPSQLAMSYFHACAIVDGRAVCWGTNDMAQLGRGARDVVPTPQIVDLGGRAIVDIAVDQQHACAHDGTDVLCWGNNYGRLGTGDLTPRATPTVIATGLSSVTGIATGFSTSCAWNTGTIKCWGANHYSSTGTGMTTEFVLTPATTTVIGSPVEYVDLGFTHGCALAGGRVSCWGRNLNGQVGVPGMNEHVSAVDTGLTNITKLAVGWHHTCAVSTTNQVYCWGLGADARTGNGMATDQTTPLLINVGAPVADIALGNRHSCALTTAGALTCWGGNTRRQLGLDPITNPVAMTPVTVMASGVTRVRAGGNNTCVELASGEVQCWGAGDFGQRADGATSLEPAAPAVIGALTGVDELQLAERGGCAQRGATVECWGLTQLLGNGDESVAVPGPPHIPCP